MIASLRGRVAHRDTTTVVVDVAGVGYLVHVPSSASIPARGEEVVLHTSLQVREESMTLYGFPERGMLQWFELLLTSSGVGPKLALAALGTHRPDVLRTAIGGADLPTLTAIPGVGKKVAERLVLELKDKVGGPGGGELPVASTGGTADPGVLGEARDALLALGYSSGEVQQALTAVTGEGGPDADAPVGELLRACLRHLGTAAFDGARP
ncbi:Holliday junction branch migration protein RuvA [Egicoccus halophilus]|uniref:Holliday junction branch migration complex subunit RuvA n=1 Tax=Egicoccus halophilus TaxID=1670830 RepID=A0A8J3EY73_9ACTN|nr:Holliday junction branch migration protein RuvA [Egicoccus halophilus]GGI07305.1 Holliday junction ATP-dependent DNA helicase RuvA [Egicoccus halophilus]